MIGIISRTEGEGSGAEVVLCYLLQCWNKDIPLVVITACNSSVSRTAKEYGIDVVELSFTPNKILPNVWLIEKILKNLKHLKIVHAWNAKSFEISWYIAKRLGIGLTCTIHDHPRSAYLSKQKLWLLKAISSSAKGVVCVSNVLANECYINGYKCNIEIIYNGIPGLDQQLVRDNVKENITIGFLGMSSHVKGFGIIAEWIRSSSVNTNIEWHLYGDVCDANKVLVEDLKREGWNNFRLMGRQRPETIFQNIDILVHASTSFDCFPTVLVEAARSGIPSIASSKGGALEIVAHQETGFIFNPEFPEEGLNYLNTLLSNEGLRSAFSAEVQKRFEYFFDGFYMSSKYYEFWTKRICN